MRVKKEVGEIKIVWLQNGRGWRKVWAHEPFGVREEGRQSLHPFLTFNFGFLI
jgi:hypothetical protein